jgi:hypothetical protein
MNSWASTGGKGVEAFFDMETGAAPWVGLDVQRYGDLFLGKCQN